LVEVTDLQKAVFLLMLLFRVVQCPEVLS